ncbi:MAG TPA: GNAT family N-acetyltransferase [Bacteroidales bacterium]|nr:GNAT family N-acetyltransferase [Bacteroidales bacterium]
MIYLLKPQDFETWIALAREVEPLFGPMADSIEFHEGIKNCIQNNNAYGIKNDQGNLAGIIALDRHNNEILWLAVGKKHRGNNYGDKLVKKAIAELESNGDIYVRTFSVKVEEGRSARIIYERNGFSDLKDAGKNPADIETVIMVRKK